MPCGSIAGVGREPVYDSSASETHAVFPCSTGCVRLWSEIFMFSSFAKPWP